jgi:indoleamine 2,3-dioxygenase
MIELPNPSDSGISPKVGFLSPHPPARSFKDSYYEPWDSIIPDLSSLIKSGELNKRIQKLPLLSIDRLHDEVEYRRAYVILAFLAHAHVWQNNEAPNENIPSQIAEPFLDVCQHLGMEPVVSYAGLCSWNWQIRNGGGMELENLDTIASFTGTRGEAAFYHVPVLVEYHGGHLIHLLIDAIRAASANERTTVLQAFKETSEAIVRMGDQFPKFHSTLDAKMFYHLHRPFMAGGRGMEEKGLPRGMVFQKRDGSEIAHKLVGGSASQSSLFPFLDYALGVHHVENAEFFEVTRLLTTAVIFSH